MPGQDNAPDHAARDRAANRRWMIGLALSLVFGIFGAVMALLSYMDRDRTTTIYRNRRSPPVAATAPGATPPAVPVAPSPDPAPAEADKGKGRDHDQPHDPK